MREGATSEQRDQLTPAVLCADYADSVTTLRESLLPTTRTDALAAQCEAIQTALQSEGAASPAAVATLTRVVAEAVADLASATVVRADGDVPAERATTAAAPREAYVVTVAEREACLAALSELLFTAVETPTGDAGAAVEARAD